MHNPKKEDYNAETCANCNRKWVDYEVDYRKKHAGLKDLKPRASWGHHNARARKAKAGYICDPEDCGARPTTKGWEEPVLKFAAWEQEPPAAAAPVQPPAAAAAPAPAPPEQAPSPAPELAPVDVKQAADLVKALETDYKNALVREKEMKTKVDELDCKIKSMQAKRKMEQQNLDEWVARREAMRKHMDEYNSGFKIMCHAVALLKKLDGV